MTALACGVSTLMILNAFSHTVGTVFGRTIASVEFQRPMPGFYSSPLLLAASLYMVKQLRAMRRPQIRTSQIRPDAEGIDETTQVHCAAKCVKVVPCGS